MMLKLSKFKSVDLYNLCKSDALNPSWVWLEVGRTIVKLCYKLIKKLIFEALKEIV